MTRQQETPYRKKGLSVFLTVLMVLSVVAMSATFVGTVAAANHDVNVDYDPDQGIYYQGQEINVTSSQEGENLDGDYQLRIVDDYDGQEVDSSSFIEELSAVAGNVTIDTSDLESGDYFLRGTDDAGNDLRENRSDTFELTEQTLDVEFDDEEVRDSGSAAETEIEFESNRGSYGMWIEIDDLDEDELEDIFVNNGDFGDYSVVDLTDDDLGEWFVLEDPADVDGEHDISFEDIDVGEYDFTFMVPDTGVIDTASITVEEAPDEDLAFSDSTYEATEGDFAFINVEFDQLDEGWLFIGDESSGYMMAAQIDNPEEEETVTVAFNSYNANDPENATFVFDPEGDSDAEIVDYRNGSQLNGDWTSNVDAPLQAGDYDLRLGLTNDTDDGDVVDEEDVATLILNERSLDDIRIGTAPADDADEDDEAHHIAEAMTDTDEIAEGDRLVVAVEGNGFFGALPADEDAIRDVLHADVDDPDAGFISLGIYQDQPGVGDQDYFEIDGASDTTYAIADSGNDTLYLVVDTDNVSTDLDRSLDRTWNATFTLGEQFDDRMDDEDDAESISSTFDIGESEVNFDNQNEDDEVQILHEENATVSGDTNLAPGTELSLRVRGDGYLLTASEVEVQSDGSWSATVDTSEDAEVGDEVQVEIRVHGDTYDEDGVIVDEIAEPPSQERIDDLEDEISDLEDEIADLEDQLAAAPSQDELDQAQADLAQAQQERDDAQAALDDAREEVDDLEGQVEDLQQDNQDLQDRIDELEEEDPDDEDDENPAFGPIAALFALLAGGALIARRRLN